MNKKLKTILILLVVVVIIGIVANYFIQNKKTPSPVAQNPLTASSRAAGVAVQTVPTAAVTEFSMLLSTIKSISIDTSLFTNRSYLSLRDFPITLGTEIVGRPNPFAPVGYDTAIGTTTTDMQVQFETLQPGKVTSTTAEFGGQALLSDTTGATVVFEYGISDLFGSATPPVAMGKNGTALFTASGLTPATLYHVRAVLVQGSNTTVGNTTTFTTTAKTR